MQVKAIKKGYDGKQIREPGDVFEFEGKLGSWMKKVGEEPAEEVEELEEVQEEAASEVAEEAPAQPKKAKCKKK